MHPTGRHEQEGDRPTAGAPRAAGRSRGRTRQLPPAPAHLVRSTTWAGVQAGETVRVDGVRQRAASWTFVAHVRNSRTGDEWVEVAGGRPGNHAVRSFRPEQIFPAASGGGRKGAKAAPGTSLADAPRLPL